MIFRRWLAAAVLFLACGLPARADSTVFSTNFNGPVPPEVTSAGVGLGVGAYAGLGPAGGAFSGQMRVFGTGSSLVVELAGLPAHVSLSLDFLLAAIDSLDCTASTGDTMTITLDGQAVFAATFGNTPASVQGYVPQPGVQLARRVDLGFKSGAENLDSAWHMGADLAVQRLPHWEATARFEIAFTGTGLGDLSDESWGIDELKVRAHSLPEIGEATVALAENGDRVFAMLSLPETYTLVQRSDSLASLSWQPVELVLPPWHGHVRVRDTAVVNRGFYRGVVLTGGVVTGLTVETTPVTIARSAHKQLQALLHLDDGTTLNVTAQAHWTTSDFTTVPVANGPGVSGLCFGSRAGSAFITAELGPWSGTGVVTVVPPTLVSLAVTPATATAISGQTRQFTCTGTFSDGSTEDLTTTVLWMSSDPAAATVSNALGSAGLATAVAGGSSTISVLSGALTAGATLTVTEPVLLSLTLLPTSASVPIGVPQRFTLFGNYDTGFSENLTETATWTTTRPDLMTVFNDPGLRGVVAGIALGNGIVTATVGALSTTAPVQIVAPIPVALQVNPGDVSLPAGLSFGFTARAMLSDGSITDVTGTVTWSSSQPATAAISNAAGTRGVATAAAPGTTTITATLGALSNSIILTVTPPVVTSLAITPSSPVISPGQKISLTATATYSDGATANVSSTATWATNNAPVATVVATGSNGGKVTGVAVGTAKITATLGSASGSVTVTVN